MKSPTVTDEDLLRAFERLCKQYNVLSKGFNPHEITAPIDGDNYDGTPQWAMDYQPDRGWRILCGYRGVAIKFMRAGGFIRTRWDFLMLLESLWWTHIFVEKQ